MSASRKWSDEHPTRLVAGWRNEYRRRAHGRHWIVVTLQFAGGGHRGASGRYSGTATVASGSTVIVGGSKGKLSF